MSTVPDETDSHSFYGRLPPRRQSTLQFLRQSPPLITLQTPDGEELYACARPTECNMGRCTEKLGTAVPRWDLEGNGALSFCDKHTAEVEELIRKRQDSQDPESSADIGMLRAARPDIMTVDQSYNTIGYQTSSRNTCAGLPSKPCESIRRPGYVLCHDHSSQFLQSKQDENTEKAISNSMNEARQFNPVLDDMIAAAADADPNFLEKRPGLKFRNDWTNFSIAGAGGLTTREPSHASDPGNGGE